MRKKRASEKNLTFPWWNFALFSIRSPCSMMNNFSEYLCIHLWCWAVSRSTMTQVFYPFWGKSALKFSPPWHLMNFFFTCFSSLSQSFSPWNRSKHLDNLFFDTLNCSTLQFVTKFSLIFFFYPPKKFMADPFFCSFTDLNTNFRLLNASSWRLIQIQLFTLFRWSLIHSIIRVQLSE